MLQSFLRTRTLAFALACAVGAPLSLPLAARAAAASSTVTGTVADRQTGLPLSGALVRIVTLGISATTDSSGAFTFANVAPGNYVLRIERDGYQPSDSDSISLGPGQSVSVTLAVQRVPSGGNALKVIGQTTVRAGETLQKASTFYRTLNTETLALDGTFRAADALRRLPGLNNGITGDTGSLGDDVQLSLRGIGTLETVAALDGHPIGQGIRGGYNYELSPIFGLRSISVDYGSGGSNLLGLDAIGGVVNFETIDPTPDFRANLFEGYGSFDKAATNVQVTGSAQHLGYALSYGVASLDGPLKNLNVFQPGAAYDQSAPVGSPVYNLGVYKLDATAVSRSGLAKIRYDFSPATRLTFTAVESSYWDDKTGNGDGDYLTPQTAIARGNNLLAKKAASDTCPAGTFTAVNANGVANGTGPNGMPDGGVKCQTPAQYANYNTGFQGAGPSWQSFDLQDEHLRLDSRAGAGNVRFDAYTSRYGNIVDRTYQLPFKSVPGDNPNVRNLNEVESGFTLSDDVAGRNNEFGFGVNYINYAYLAFQNFKFSGAPIAHNQSAFIRDAYRPLGSPLSAYLDLNVEHSTITNTSYANPRGALVYEPTSRDVVRFAAGATTTQPSSDQLGKTFVQSLPGGAGGGGSVKCSGLNSIGTAPSSILGPERGVDEEVSVGHQFYGDSNAQFSFYNTNVYDKIYSTLVPISQSGTGFIDPTFLAQALAKVQGLCGVANASSLLGVSGNINVGQLRAQGFTFSGRARLHPQFFIDYDWATTSTALVSVPVTYLQSNLSIIPGSQLPRLPLHTLDIAFDGAFPHRNGVDVRYTLHTVSANNTKALPPYSFSDLRVLVPAGPGSFAVSVGNLFNQYAEVRGLENAGVPLALNQYATAASYAPYIGTASTEQFGLPYRSIFFEYALHLR
jgi:outer membrane receptor protein involved in Fe transport